MDFVPDDETPAKLPNLSQDVAEISQYSHSSNQSNKGPDSRGRLIENRPAYLLDDKSTSAEKK